MGRFGVPALFGKRNVSMSRNLALLVLLGFSVGHAAACFTVYDRTNAIVYYAQTPPVDMTPPFNEKLQRAFPGSHLVFGNTTGCPVKQAGYNPAKPLAPTSPLFTDKRTAEEMKLSHSVLPNGAALVAKPPAGMRPGFTVMNLNGQASTDRAVTRPASASSKQSPVITEMRDPPVTVIERDGSVKEVR
jgi:hypothetical protein